MPQSVRIDMSGQTFGRLTVLSYAATVKGRAQWLCRCTCGNAATVQGKYLRAGRTRSCGCYHEEVTRDRSTTHGMSGSGTYGSYQSMLARCTNPNQQSFAKYGAKGVKVCDRWVESFANFLADMGERPEGMTLERNNPFGNYEPDNCCWATPETQSKNRRGDVALSVLSDIMGGDHAWVVEQAFRLRFPKAKA